MNKIIQFKQLPEFIKQLKRKNQQVVLVGGCFDILHLGHIRFLKAAKQYGTVIVALEPDTKLTSKNPSRPIHTQVERAEMLSQLVTVDYIICLPHFNADADYAQLTQTISPQALAVTQGDPQRINKQNHAKLIGATVVDIPKINTPSTTQLAKLLKLE